MNFLDLVKMRHSVRNYETRFRDDVNFTIVNLLVREQLDLLMNTDLCKEHSFLEVYESIMFTYLRGISTEKGARKLEEFIREYRKDRQSNTE